MSNEKITLIVVAAIVIGHILFGIIWLIYKINKKK
jgi:heme/copper-type cytochrome/quinol oxidase subunit 4